MQPFSPAALANLLLSPNGQCGRLAYLGFLIAGFLLWRLAGREAHLVSMVLIYPWFCLAVKRLHDIGASGAWVLAPTAIPLIAVGLLLWVAMSLGGNGNDADYRAIGFGGGLLVAMATVLGGGLFNCLLLFAPGEAKDNRYGPRPQPLYQN